MPPKNQQNPAPQKLEPEKIIFSWKAATRIQRKKDRSFWVKLISVFSLLGFIFFLAEGIMPVILLISVLFLFYVLSSVEPETAQYSITNLGINVSESKNSWGGFRSFRFITRNDTTVLSLDMHKLPGKIELIINDEDLPKIEAAVSKYIPREDLPQTRFDKASEWVSDKIS